MIAAGRDLTMVGDQEGQSVTTEAGENPREVKYQTNDASESQDTACASEPLPPMSTTGGSFAGSGNGGDDDTRQPTQNPTLEGSNGTSQLRRQLKSSMFPASAEATSTESRVASIPASSKECRVTATETSAIASSTNNIPLLALGQQVPTIDVSNPLTQPSEKIPVPPAPSVSQTKKTGTALRRGKWTVEEEAYVARVIQDFNSGFLNAPAGTTLRSYLSEKLQCDPMRITKKFTGDSCIGKRVFHPAVRNPSNASAIDKAQAELDALERRWRRRLEMQQRESVKKAAASAAAAAASSGRSHGFTTLSTIVPGGNAGSFSSNGVTQTASWLDRASNILKETGSQNGGVSIRCSQQKFSLTQEQAQALQSLPKREIEMQMKEVERLIHEGPIIQQTSAGLPLLVHHSSDFQLHRQTPPVPTTIVAPSAVESTPDGQQTPPEPADKRMRTGAEDAEALVGFLTAVRASAAAGTDSFSN